MKRWTWSPKTISRLNRMPNTMETSTWNRKLWSNRPRHWEICRPGHLLEPCTLALRRPIQKNVAKGTSISFLLQILKTIFDSVLSLTVAKTKFCVPPPSIWKFRVYALSGLWIFGYMNISGMWISGIRSFGYDHCQFYDTLPSACNVTR